MENYDTQPGTLYLDKKAADLYLEFWQMEESPNHPKDKNFIGTQKSKEFEIRKNEIKNLLMELGYPNPFKVGYDNESEPMIEWKTKGFNWTKYMEEEKNMGSDD